LYIQLNNYIVVTLSDWIFQHSLERHGFSHLRITKPVSIAISSPKISASRITLYMANMWLLSSLLPLLSWTVIGEGHLSWFPRIQKLNSPLDYLMSRH
jgi:hypothetical protein